MINGDLPNLVMTNIANWTMALIEIDGEHRS